MALKGAILGTKKITKYYPAYRVKAVDTTAAGDAFSAALAVAIAEGKSYTDAVNFANAAGALAVTKVGAQPSMPTRDKLEKFLRDLKK